MTLAFKLNDILRYKITIKEKVPQRSIKKKREGGV